MPLLTQFSIPKLTALLPIKSRTKFGTYFLGDILKIIDVIIIIIIIIIISRIYLNYNLTFLKKNYKSKMQNIRNIRTKRVNLVTQVKVDLFAFKHSRSIFNLRRQCCYFGRKIIFVLGINFAGKRKVASNYQDGK